MNCTTNNCDKEVHAKGLCFKHYVKFRRANNLEPKSLKSCSEEGCTRKYHGEGLCAMHYKRLWDDRNREYLREQSREYGRTHKEQCLAQQNRWRKSNWDYYKSYLATQKKIVKRATPKWMERDTIIAEFRACPKGMEVDHIIPLQGKNVSGLNVPWNFQYLTPYENNTKNNSFDGTYDNEGWRKRLKKAA